MNLKTRSLILKTLITAAIVVAVPLAFGPGNALATTVYLGDGVKQNAQGGWDLPAQGTCPAGAAAGYSGIDTRPECVALRLNYATSALCTAVSDRSWTTGGVCNDLVNNTQPLCAAAVDRLWNPGTGVCSIVMSGDDRNNVVCAQHGGTWVLTGTCTGSWVMPARNDPAYGPTGLLTGNGPGDQCLRCHNADTQYNGPRVRDTENTIYQGHKNMARKVAPVSPTPDLLATHGYPWGGPPFSCTSPLYTDEQNCEANGFNWNPTLYPSDDAGNVFDWVNGQATVSGTPRDVAWIYGDWLAPLPRAIYRTVASTSKTCTNPLYTTQTTCEGAGAQWVFNAGASYSCGRCHTTGWTSDGTVKTTKEPEKSFPGITWDRNSAAGTGVVNLTGGVLNDGNKYSSWDVWGISCTRCHNSVIDDTLVSCTGYTAGQASCLGLNGSWSSTGSVCSGITAAQCTAGSGTAANFVAASGTSSHHNNLTAPDAGSGACTDARWTTEAACTAAGGSWLTACSINPTAGVCTLGASTSAACTAIPGASWTPVTPFCSNAYFTNQADCLAADVTNDGTADFTWTTNYCTTADTQATCTGGSGNTAKTWRLNGTQQSCLLNSPAGTWSFSKCSVAGFCNKGTCSDVTKLNAIDCEAAGATWTTAATTEAACEALLPVAGQFAYATDIVRCDDIGGRWTGSNTNRGQIISRVCMDCHRQEKTGVPYGNASADVAVAGGDYSLANPGQFLKVGPAHGTVSPVSHPHANMFLNSPHARFTGNFNQVATGRNGFEYKSFFMADGEAANTGNGCTGCHDVHESIVEASSPFPAIKEECTECHAGPYKKDLTKIRHLWGPGTPMENAATEEAEACEICHMPEGLHLWRINPEASYSTFPASALTGVVNANTAPEPYTNPVTYAPGTNNDAVWVDVNAACGQCHGGGTAHAVTTGSVSASSATLTVASATGISAGNRIRIAGAGALTYDDPPDTDNDGTAEPIQGDFDTYVVSVSGTTVTLAGKATVGVVGARVEQNPVRENFMYLTKAELASVAKGMHEGSGRNYQVTFTTVATGLSVTATPSVNCGTSPCFAPFCEDPTKLTQPACAAAGKTWYTDFLYEWDWDGTATSTGNPGTHVYATGGTKTIGLKALLPAISGYPAQEVGSAERNVLLIVPDLPPTATGACNWDANTWTMSYVDASTDDNPGLTVIADWADGLPKSSGPAGSTLTHTYRAVGTYIVTVRALDSKGQSSTYTCTTQATPAFFKIDGTLKTSLNAAIKGATVQVQKLNPSNVFVTVKTVSTDAAGAFTTGPTLTPGTYALKFTKYGYTFPLATTPPVADNPLNLRLTLGGDKTANIVSLTAPTMAAPITKSARSSK